MLLRKFGVAMTLICWTIGASAAEKAPSNGSTPAVSEDFSTSVAPGWRVAKGDWKLVDGAWQGAEIPADMHGAVARYPLEFTDGVIDFDFKLDGTKGISLSINSQKEHVCRLSIRETGFQVAKDDQDHAGPDQRVLLAEDTTPLKPGTWYHAHVEIAGPRMTAQVGDASNPGKSIGGENEKIAVPKANFGFTVAGRTASFKNLRVTTTK